MAYAATPCAVLTWRMLLRAVLLPHVLLRNTQYSRSVCCYAIPGARIAHAATRLRRGVRE
eukprot:3941461-Rhodomonas_salina.2